MEEKHAFERTIQLLFRSGKIVTEETARRLCLVDEPEGDNDLQSARGNGKLLYTWFFGM